MVTNYESPLSSRYADEEMKYLFSAEKKFRTWRRLWIALAQAERELGLPVTQEQIDELEAHKDDINYEVAQAREKEVRHDVMSMSMHTACSAQRQSLSFISVRPPAMWATTPTSSS